MKGPARRPHAARSPARPIVALAGALVLVAFVRAAAAAPAAPPRRGGRCDRERLLDEARALLRTDERDRARAALREMLYCDRGDAEALAGLARLDAWEGRWREAEEGYRAVLLRHPEDHETRAALVDLLLWQDRWNDAESEIDEGLRRGPSAPLLERRARLLFWKGELVAARAAADRAAALKPGDDETLRVLRRQLFLGEARLSLRNDTLPAGYADLSVVEIAVRQRFRQLTFLARTEQSWRAREAGGTRERDGFYAVGSYLTINPSVTLGVEAGVGAPALSVARFAGLVHGAFAIGKGLTAQLGLSYRFYDGDKHLFIAFPSLGAHVTDTVVVEARYWLAHVSFPPPEVASATKGATEEGRIGSVLHTVGAGARWSHPSGIMPGLDYAFGAQAELVRQLALVIETRSHVVSPWVDVAIGRHGGVRPLYRLELRSRAGADAVPVHTLEIGGYARW